MKAVKRWFISFKLKVKKTYRIWFPKKEKTWKKRVKGIVNEVAKAQVRVMQSRHYIKQAIVAVSAIYLFLVPVISAVQIQNVAQLAQEANETAHETREKFEDMPDPTYGQIIGNAVGATIDGMIGAYNWFKNVTMHS